MKIEVKCSFALAHTRTTAVPLDNLNTQNGVASKTDNSDTSWQQSPPVEWAGLASVSQTNLLGGALVLGLDPLVVLQDSEDGSAGRLLQWLVLLVLLVRHIPAFEGGPQSGQHVLLVVLLLASRACLSSVSGRHVSLLPMRLSNVFSG